MLQHTLYSVLLQWIKNTFIFQYGEVLWNKLTMQSVTLAVFTDLNSIFVASLSEFFWTGTELSGEGTLVPQNAPEVSAEQLSWSSAVTLVYFIIISLCTRGFRLTMIVAKRAKLCFLSSTCSSLEHLLRFAPHPGAAGVPWSPGRACARTAVGTGALSHACVLSQRGTSQV